LVRVHEEREENLVMTLDLDKMTTCARDYYIMKQEIVEKRGSHQSSTNAE
jgi:hypothetical protein